MRIIFTVFILIITHLLAGQDRPSTEVSPIYKVELLKLPALDNSELLKRTKNSKGTANRFAEAREVNISPSLGGTWENTKSKTLVWRQRVLSPNAHTLNLGFTEFFLPSSASLFIYNPDMSEVIGPLTNYKSVKKM